jgi:hypothetical protein
MLDLGTHPEAIIEGYLLAAAVIAVPIRHQVMGYAVQPSRKWYASVLIIGDMSHRPGEDPRSQVFGVMLVTGAVIYVVVNAAYIAVI